MKEIEISVPDMQSAHCQARVNNAVKDVQGAQILKVAAGKLTLSVTSDSTQNEVINAILKAGYTVSVENEAVPAMCASDCCTH